MVTVLLCPSKAADAVRGEHATGERRPIGGIEMNEYVVLAVGVVF